MYIKKLNIDHFGKYNKREIELQRGLNVIYGPNEAGKTTIKDFIVAMFYGIERQRGIAAKTDEYTRRAPLDGAGYSGSMMLQKDADTYIIDRVFKKEKKTLDIYLQESGRRLPSEEGMLLPSELIDLDKNGYVNTLCISSTGAVYKSELQEEFRTYLMNINETHAVNLDMKATYGYLNQQKKALNRKSHEQELATLSAKMEDVDLSKELARIAKEREAIENSLSAAQEQQAQKVEAQEVEELETIEASKQEKKKSLFTEEQKEQMDPQLKQILSFIKIMFAFGVFAIAFLLIYILPISIHYKLWLCVIALVVVAYVVIRTEWKKLNAKRNPSGKQSANPVKNQTVANKSTKEVDFVSLSRQLADLQVQENEILKLYAKNQEYETRYAQVKAELAQISKEEEAIDLAITTIQSLSENIYDKYAPGLARYVSEMVSCMTKGVYTDVRLDDKLAIMVRKNGTYIGAEYLSTGTLEQIYLAVRLAVAEHMSQVRMPLLLDDIFGPYDDVRLEAALNCLVEYDSDQVLIFTANERLADVLDRTDIEYNYIEL